MGVSIPRALRKELSVLQLPPSKYWKCQKQCLLILLCELESSVLYSKEKDLGSRLTSRVKERDSIIDKLNRRKIRRVNTLEDIEKYINDLVGVRMVVDHLGHADIMTKRLIDFPDWIHKNPPEYNVARESGYHAYCHLDVILDLPRHGKIQAEVQILTSLQNSWTKWAHPIYKVVRSYKKNRRLPPVIEGKISELGFNLHAADILGSQVLDEFDRWRQKVGMKK